MFTADDYVRLGPEAKASPPWRTPADREAVRAAVADGTVDMLVTDHAPHRHDEKSAHAGDFAAVPGGFPGVQTLLATLLALVDQGLIGLTDLVRLAATRPASRFGLGLRKGRLRPGFDADILVVDTARPFTVRRQDQLSKNDFTPFERLTVSASLERVFLRGQSVDGSGMATGRVLGVAR
jgi:dihydroorotase-like cyclic amidohydrolase